MDGRIRSLERWIVVFIAVHSAGVGLLLLLAPEWSADFGGWSAAAPLFFTRQAGVFHIVVAFGYSLEYFRFGSVSFLVATKAVAFVFLATAFILGEKAWAVPLSAIVDGLMAVGVAGLHAKLRGSSIQLGAS